MALIDDILDCPVCGGGIASMMVHDCPGPPRIGLGTVRTVRTTTAITTARDEIEALEIEPPKEQRPVSDNNHHRVPPALDRAQSEAVKVLVEVKLSEALAEAFDLFPEQLDSALLEVGLAAIRWGERTVS